MSTTDGRAAICSRLVPVTWANARARRSNLGGSALTLLKALTIENGEGA